jgi:chaperonin cofactor prefoldin
MELLEALSQLSEIQKLICEHQNKQNYHQGFGTAAQRVKAILREYEDKTTKAYSDVKHVRDDMLTFFRALALVLNMTGEAATHAEKNARLRGAIELLETAIEKLRYQNLESLFDIYRWPDLFRSEWPTRRLMERIHDLERQVKELQPQAQEPKGVDGDTVADTEPPRW